MIHEVISIVLVNNQLMLVDGLASALAHEPSIEVVGMAADVATAVSVVRRTAPQVVVLDDQLPDGDGVELARQLLAEWPDVALLMLTTAADGQLLTRARAAGFAGLLTTQSSVADLIEAVHAVGGGGTGASLLDGEAQVLGGEAPPSVSANLSARELEAMQLAAQGLPNRAIAEAMYLSSHTIKNYMQSAIKKLGAHSKLEAVTIALREGIVTVDR